ncbi:hypothetical protein BG57_30725 [Caballeronia grimmiae]|uniref:Uncharacterized protein n=1 Tax=Caballeronia grimmiae TaxID=1071679 RepID=A0A069NJW2_9BURK|nr:hypothetical protein BG57_30725 [Caballeronia grimmiae]
MSQKTLDVSALEQAIEKCQQEIDAETDRLIRQTRAGIDASTSRELLFALHDSLEALKHSKRALKQCQRAL